GKYPPHTIGTSGRAARTALQTGTAWLSCGPGITETASSDGSRAATDDSRARISAAGSATMLPSTSDHGSLPSSTAASDRTDSGSGCLPGVVDSGLNSTIIELPRPRTRPACATDAIATTGDEAATGTVLVRERIAPAAQGRGPGAPDRRTS